MTLRYLAKRLAQIVADADASPHAHVRKAVDEEVIIDFERNTKRRRPHRYFRTKSFVSNCPLGLGDGVTAFTIEAREEGEL